MTNSLQDAVETELSSVTERIKDGLRRGKFTARELQTALAEKTKHLARTTDYYVHENPWTAVAIGAGAGVALGMLMGNCEARRPSAVVRRRGESPLRLLQSTLVFAVSAAKAIQAFRSIR